MKAVIIFFACLLILIAGNLQAQTCIGSSQLRTGSNAFQWLEATDDNLLYNGGVYYTSLYVFDGDTLFAPPGAQATCYVVVTDTNFNLVRMFNHISLFRAGGAFNDLRIWNMTIDAQQNVLFTGSYTDSLLVYGADSVLSDNYQEGFLAKSDSLGLPLLLKSFGSRVANTNYRFEDRGHCVTTDAAGNIYVGASFEGDYFQINSDTVHNGIYVGLNSYRQAAVFSLTPTGQTRWLKSFGTPTQDESPYGIAVDSAGNVTVCGATSASNQNFTFGQFVYHFKTSTYGFQSFAGKFDTNGNAVWFFPLETYYATGPDIGAYDAAIDANGNSYIAGYFDASAVFNNDTVLTLNYTSSFLLKINSSGQKEFVKIGNIETFYPYPVALKIKNDKIFMTGQSYTNRLNFENFGLCCSRDVYFAMYDTSGTILFLKGLSTAGSAQGTGFDVAFTTAGSGVSCGAIANGQITIEPNTVTASSTGDYYLVRFGNVASNGLSMSLVNNGSDTIGCGGYAPLQMIAAPATNTRYFWYAITDTIAGPFYSATLSATPKITTTYYASAYLGACRVEDSIKVFVEPISVNAGNDTMACIGSLVQLQADTLPGAKYLWSPATGLNYDTIYNPVLNLTTTGQYYFQLTNAVGCKNLDTLTVVALNSPVAAFTTLTTNLNINFTGLASGATSFMWDFGDGQQDSLSLIPSHLYSVSGNYQICLIVQNACGSDTACQQFSLTNVGINAIQASNFTIYQTTTEINIDAVPNASISIIDLAGKIIYSERMNANKKIINKQFLQPGIYFVIVAANNKCARMKIWK